MQITSITKIIKKFYKNYIKIVDFYFIIAYNVYVSS